MIAALGLDRDGRYDFLYDASQFFEVGSLGERFDLANQAAWRSS
jgi:hypothetical protein